MRLKSLCCAVGIIAASPLLAGAETVFEGPQADIDAILAVFAEWERARNAGDVDAVVAVHHPDMRIMTRDRAILEGHAGVRTFYAENYAVQSNRQLLGSVSELRVLGDVGIVIGRFLVLDAENNIEDPGYYLIMLRKNAQGEWKIYRDIDTPSPDGLALKPPAPAPATRISSRSSAPADFRAWVDARAGTGAPVHWVAEGGVYAYPSGKKLFGLVGFDSSTVIWPADLDDGVLHLTRKTFTYTDPVSGEILTEYRSKTVEPIAYPYQLITYRLEDGTIHGDVEQGVAPQVQIIKSADGLRLRSIGDDTLAVTASVFLDIPLPGGKRLDAWENYDFFIHDRGSVQQPYQLSWQRYGDLPQWAGGGKGIYQLLSWRVESAEDFPPKLLAWAREHASFWLKPPASLAEIRALQAGTASACEGC